MADTYDLDIVQGETFTRVFSQTTDDVDFDFSGYDVEAQIRVKEANTSLLLLDLTDYFTKAVDGLSVTLRIPADVTAEVDAAKFGRVGATRTASWDCFVIDSNDPTTAYLLLQGRATMDPQVTDTVVTP